MRKNLSTLIALLVVGTLILTACGAPATSAPTEAPASTEVSAATDAPAEAATEAPTTAPVEELSGTISVSGAFALYPMMTVWADEFSKLHPDVQFDVQGGGAGKGMTDTIAGAVDIGMISRNIKPEEESQGIFWVAVTKDAVFPIISAQNPVAEQIQARGISQDVFAKIFVTQEIKTWGEVVGDASITDEIHVYTRSDSAGAAEQWAKFAGGKAQDDLKGIGINGEPAMVATVAGDPLGIGFGNLNSVYDLSTGKVIEGVAVPPIDIDANGKTDAGETYNTKEDAFTAVANGVFPEPPARFEYLATKGEPSGLVLAFIQWIVTDGQQYLESAGYVPLTADQQAASLDKLK